MDFLEFIYNATGFNAFLEYDFRPFILKTFLFSFLLAGPLSLLSILIRSLFRRLNKKGGEYHE